MADQAQVVVVTGVTQGIGRAMVDRLVELGHVVVGCGRSPSAIAELSDRFGRPHRFSVVDVSDPAAVEGWVGEVLSELGPPHRVWNNAAIIHPNAPIWEMHLDQIRQVLDINILGTVAVCRSFLPALIEAERGVIVNFTSGWGRTTAPEVSIYCASKWAIEGFTRSIAQELPPGLAAIPVNPGIINTRMLQSCFGSAANQYPDADAWSRIAVPFLLDLEPKDNGKPLTVPQS